MREIDDLVEKARKFLGTAELAFHSGDHDSCASRSYYSMFFMVEAVLLSRGLRASTHKGIMTLFWDHFLKPGIFEKDIGKSFAEIHDKRLIGDYGVGFSLTETEAELSLRSAKEFVQILQRYLDTHDL